MIPVFFLFSVGALPQEAGFLDARCAALAGCYTCQCGGAMASLNQACLAGMEGISLFLNHSRPFASPELGITNLGVQGGPGNSGMGLSLSTMGIAGMRQSSLWLGCGIRAGRSLRVGAGIHIQATGIRGKLIHRLGTGCALGMHYEPEEGLSLACHISLPVYQARENNLPARAIAMACGMRYCFFETAAFHIELEGNSRSSYQIRGGIEVFMKRETSLFLGLGNNPLRLSFGIHLCPGGIPLVLSAQWDPGSGFHPSSMLGYDW